MEGGVRTPASELARLLTKEGVRLDLFFARIMKAIGVFALRSRVWQGR